MRHFEISILTIVILLLTSSEGKVWTKCELFKDLQKHHVSEDQIPLYLCIAEKESGYNSSLKHLDSSSPSGAIKGEQCKYHDFGIFQIRSRSTCIDKDLSPNCQTPTALCNVSCSDLLDDDLRDDVECLGKILLAKKYQDRSTKADSSCLGKSFEKVVEETICKDIRQEVIQIEKEPHLGYCGTATESTIKTHNETVVCVITSLSHRRESLQAKFDLADIDPDLCTHLLYRVARIDDLTFGVVSEDAPLDTDDNGPQWFTHIPALKVKHPHLKVILALGGWNAGVTAFQSVASNTPNRNVFIKSAVELLTKYKFDGMDILWMWPGAGYRGGNPQDKSHLTDLLIDMKKSFDEHNLMLTITMNGDPATIENGYDLAQVPKLVDQIHVLAIDYAGPWSEFTGHHSPLHSGDRDQPSVAKLINFLIADQVPPEKLVLGIAFFGRKFKLQDPSVTNGLGNSSIKGGFPGGFYPDPQEIGYNEICYELENNRESWTFFRDTRAKAAFAKNGEKWISYDDAESVREKVKFGMSKKIKGFMAWSIDTDDFKGTNCLSHEGVKYPLLRTINRALSTGAEGSTSDNNLNGCISPRHSLITTTEASKGVKTSGVSKANYRQHRLFICTGVVFVILWKSMGPLA